MWKMLGGNSQISVLDVFWYEVNMISKMSYQIFSKANSSAAAPNKNYNI